MSFREMITKKRIKVLTLVVVLIYVAIVKGSVSPKILFVIKKGQSPYEAVCIAEENAHNNSGITWIFPIPETPEEMPTIETRYIPAHYDNEYSCDFSTGNKCLKQWNLSDWLFSKSSDRFQPVVDSRSDEFTTLFTTNISNKYEAHERMEIPPHFNLGLSIRSSYFGEVLFCETWNPYTSPCYYLNIGGKNGETMALYKFKKFPKTSEINDSENLAKFEGELVVAAVEWKTYNITFSENGVFEVTDIISKKSILKYIDTEKLKTTYLILRSRHPVLWKVHQINYIYTTKSKLSKFGPTLTLNSNELCVSFFVWMCKKCTFTFSLTTMEKQEIFLRTIKYEKGDEETWKNVKLVHLLPFASYVKIHVKTEVDGAVDAPFWAISNVRVCNNQEIRLSKFFYHVTKENITLRPQYDLSCQSLRHPEWRPTVHQSILSELKFIKVTTEPTEMTLQWDYVSQKRLTYQPYYLIEYKGNDYCNDNTSNGVNNRRKSSGLLIVQKDEGELKNLIPYTTYNVSVTDVISDTRIESRVDTQATALSTLGEIPRNVLITPGNTSVRVHWKRPSCNKTFGPNAYRVQIIDGNETLQYLIVYEHENKLDFIIKNLQPFHEYVVEILTARSALKLHDSKFVRSNYYKFSTSPGIALQPSELNVYEIDRFYASLRFKISENAHGVPEQVKVEYCNLRLNNKCQIYLTNLTKCLLWDYFYCVEINDLNSNTKYKFSVYIKNEETTAFGNPTSVTAITTAKKPGKPSNVSYEPNCYHDVQYCNLRIKWSHPFNPKGMITAFRISLKDSYQDTNEVIEEVYKIPNRQYHKQYSYLIKYIPYGIHHVLSVEGINFEFNEGETEFVEVKIPPFYYANNTPTVDSTDSFLIATFPPTFNTLKTNMFVVVQDFNESVQETKDVPTLSCYVEKCNKFGSTWLAVNHKENVDDDNSTVVFFEEFIPINKYENNKMNLSSEKLKENTVYCLTIVIQEFSTEDNSSECKIFSFKNVTTKLKFNTTTTSDAAELQFSSSSLALPILFALISICVGGILLYRHILKKRRVQNRENYYEEMPFDDLEEAVHNPLYDRLVHT